MIVLKTNVLPQAGDFYALMNEEWGNKMIFLQRSENYFFAEPQKDCFFKKCTFRGRDLEKYTFQKVIFFEVATSKNITFSKVVFFVLT